MRRREYMTYVTLEGQFTNAFLVVRNNTNLLVYSSLGQNIELLLDLANADFKRLTRTTHVDYVLRKGGPSQKSESLKTLENIFMSLLDGSSTVLPDYEYLFGTSFQQKVWNELANVRFGNSISYSGIAKNIGSPNATRAVGNAVGQNKLALVIPCHRCLPANGLIGGFRWGHQLKKKLLAHERTLKFKVNVLISK